MKNAEQLDNPIYTVLANLSQFITSNLQEKLIAIYGFSQMGNTKRYIQNML
ncbi:hypothetical protein [Clostridium puniceum]|uniref:hypothetical protein n=1 Tax=Clostridium puniceum TaxID=29367 RepID=UPI0013016161|nr:hypothetical protein [Clostridium puniceum]